MDMFTRMDSTIKLGVIEESEVADQEQAENEKDTSENGMFKLTI